MTNLLRWWLVCGLTAVVAIIMLATGTLQQIVAADTSYLCIGIMILFVGSTIHCGYSHYRLLTKPLTQRSLDIGTFCGIACSKLGLLGTIIGFIMMVTGLSELNLADPASSRGMVSAMSYGIGTALYTTLVGLVCNMLLGVQYFLLGRAMKYGS